MPAQEDIETTYRDPECVEEAWRENEWRASWYYDYKKYQEEILYSRVNIFMLAVSVLAAALVAVKEAELRILIAALGLISTFCWHRAVRRQRQIVEDLRIQLEDADCLYKEMKRYREVRDGDPKRKVVSGQRLLFVYLPLLFGVFWILAFAWATSLVID